MSSSDSDDDIAEIWQKIGNDLNDDISSNIDEDSTHQHHNRRCTSLSSSSTTSSDNDTKIAKQIKKKEKTAAIKAGREKRAKFIGLAKAVDRGQFQNTYSPGGTNGHGFTAKSGLPNLEKMFCVLGIESSCDDTGGEFRCMIGFKYMMCLSLF